MIFSILFLIGSWHGKMFSLVITRIGLSFDLFDDIIDTSIGFYGPHVTKKGIDVIEKVGFDFMPSLGDQASTTTNREKIAKRLDQLRSALKGKVMVSSLDEEIDHKEVDPEDAFFNS